MKSSPRYDRIHAALGDSRTIVNVGAGTGSYEPMDRNVIAVVPSDVMADDVGMRLIVGELSDPR